MISSDGKSPFARRMLPALLALLFVNGVAQMVSAGAAAFFREDFGLSEAELAKLFAYLSLGSLGAVILGRVMDRVGRRRMLLVNVTGASLGALGIALAPSLWVFVVFQIVNVAFAGALAATARTFLTEELDAAGRARGQAAAGIAVQVGSGAALIGVAIAVEFPGGWRWVFAAMALPVLFVPWLARVFRETGHFAKAAARGELLTARARELLGRRYRGRTLGLVVAVFLANGTVISTMTWLLYHAETALGLRPAIATAIVIGGGAVGLAGFPLGAHFANRIGRRWTALCFGLVLWACNVGYYWVPAGLGVAGALSLGALFSLGSVGFAGASVALRTGGPELFPTRLRGTMSGITLAVAALSGMTTHYSTSVLAGALSSFPAAISVVATVGVLGFGAYFLVLPETRGLSLDEAALERQ